MMKRTFSAWFFLRLLCVLTFLLILFCLSANFGWAQFTKDSANAIAAAVHVFPAVEQLFDYIRWGGRYFNIPILAILIWLAWLLSITANGMIVASRMLPTSATAFEILVFGFTAGFVDMSLIIFLLFAIGFSGAKVFGVLLTIELLFSVFSGAFLYPQFYRRFSDSLKQQLHLPADAAVRLLALGTIVLLAVGFFYCLTPPIQSDAMRYHLTVPQEFLKSNSLAFIPLNSFSHFPFLIQMHYGLALSLNVPEMTHLIHWTCLVMTAIAISTFTGRFVVTAFSRCRAGYVLVPGMLYLAAPATYIVGCWPFADQSTVLFVLLSCYLLLWIMRNLQASGKMQQIKEIRNYFIKTFNSDSSIRSILYRRHMSHFREMTWFCGIIIGGAIGTKYTTLPFLCFVGASLFVYGYITLSTQGRVMLRAAANAIMLTALVVGCCWFLRNLIETNNPFYPLLNSWIHGGDWTPDNAAFYAARMAEKGQSKTLLHLLMSPWNSTFSWLQYEGHYPGVITLAVFFSAFLTGCFLTGWTIFCKYSKQIRKSLHTPLRFFTPSTFTPVLFMFAFGLCWWVMWFYSYQSNRLSTVTFAMFLPIAMFVPLLCINLRRYKLYKATVWLLVLCGLYSMSWTIDWICFRSKPIAAMSYLLGNISKEEYMNKALSYKAAYDYLNNHTDSDVRVMVIGEHRFYGARFNGLWSDWFNTPAPAYYIRKNNITTTEEFFNCLAADHFEWIMINNFELKLQGASYTDRLTENENKIIKDIGAYAAAHNAEIKHFAPDADVIKLDTNTTATETQTTSTRSDAS